MAFDEQDRFDHTETDNHVNEQNQTAGTAQNEGTEGSGLYRMTREDLKNSTLYTDTDRRSEYTSGTAYENRTNTARTGSSYAAGNDYSYYHPTQNSGGNGGNGGCRWLMQIHLLLYSHQTSQLKLPVRRQRRDMLP